MIKSLPVYVGVYTHQYGTDVALYQTYEAAENARQIVARDFWDALETDEPMPELPADRYFDLAEEEYFEILLRDLEYDPDLPLQASEPIPGDDA